METEISISSYFRCVLNDALKTEAGQAALYAWDRVGQTNGLEGFWAAYDEWTRHLQAEWIFKPWENPDSWCSIGGGVRTGRHITVEHKSKCRMCGYPIRRGTTAAYYGRGCLMHVSCDLRRKGHQDASAMARDEYKQKISPLKRKVVDVT